MVRNSSGPADWDISLSDSAWERRRGGVGVTIFVAVGKREGVTERNRRGTGGQARVPGKTKPHTHATGCTNGTFGPRGRSWQGSETRRWTAACSSQRRLRIQAKRSASSQPPLNRLKFCSWPRAQGGITLLHTLTFLKSSRRLTFSV